MQRGTFALQRVVTCTCMAFNGVGLDETSPVYERNKTH